MAPSVGDNEFHPEDPTVWLWKRLLRRYPGHGKYKPRTKAERREAAIRVQEYYADKPHPRKGKPFGNKKKK